MNWKRVVLAVVTLAVVALSQVACGENEPQPQPNPPVDAGTGPEDAGLPPVQDAGSRDAGIKPIPPLQLEFDNSGGANVDTETADLGLDPAPSAPWTLGTQTLLITASGGATANTSDRTLQLRFKTSGKPKANDEFTCADPAADLVAGQVAITYRETVSGGARVWSCSAGTLNIDGQIGRNLSLSAYGLAMQKYTPAGETSLASGTFVLDFGGEVKDIAGF